MINKIIRKHVNSIELCSCISESYAHWKIFSSYKQTCATLFSTQILEENQNSILILYINYVHSAFLKKLYYTYNYRFQNGFEVPKNVQHLASDRKQAIAFREFLIAEYIKDVIEEKKEVIFTKKLYLYNPIYAYNNLTCISSTLQKNPSVIYAPDILE